MSSIFDAVTNLPNKELFLDRLKIALAFSKRTNQTLAVLIIGIHNLKRYYQLFNKDYQNELILNVARRLESCIREGDTLSKYDDTHFAIILHDVSLTEIGQVAERLCNVLSKVFRIDQNTISISSNMGVSLFPYHGSTIDQLIKNAWVAMYQAKEIAPNSYVLFNKDINEKNLRNLVIKTTLSKAIEKKQFKVLYQPQVCLNTNELFGVEALLRWEHPDFGTISPGEFIPYLESTGQIIPVGEWLIDHTCQQIKQWNHNGIKPFKVSINVSSYQLYDDYFVDIVIETIRKYQLSFDQLILEITESIELIYSSDLVKKLGFLKTLGVSLAIDDFGTGYSSFNLLKQLPLSFIKLDKTFLENMGNTEKEIIQAIVSMAHALNCKVIAEGVEDINQVYILKDKNCDIIQGYGISHPLTSDYLQSQYMELQQNIKKAMYRGE